ncbi:MAG: OmpA family protein [Bacteroidales bacterium]|nr:OmpA family protein [Bacteroidales bacterium]
MKNSYLIFFVLLFALNNINAQTKVDNLGKNINSSCYDYRPKLTADGQNLYFTRLICMDEETMADEGLLFYSQLNSDSTWTKAMPLEAEFNKLEFSPYLYSVSPDNNQILLTLKDSYNNLRYLCKVYRTADGWSKPDTIDLGIILPELNSTFALSDNGRIIIFSYESVEKNREFYGGKDLYVSFLDKDEKWSKPRNLGSKINTQYIDLNPFLASDNRTLYFSSKQKKTYGQNDIYMSKRLDNTWINWSEPVNVGSSINDENWNDGFFIPIVGDFAYFNSERSGFGQGDIFRVEISDDIKPDKVVLVQSVLVDKMNMPIGEAKVYYENLATGEIVGTAFSHPKTGEFQISLPLGIKYGIYAEVEGQYAVTSFLDLKSDSSLLIVKDSLRLIPIEKGETIRLNNIFFSSNSSVLSVESYSELKRLVRVLKSNPNLKIRIEGHTDNAGSDDFNLELSGKRAQSVASFLLSKGAQNKQLDVKAYGETLPVADNSTEIGKKHNRRVEFTVLDN